MPADSRILKMQNKTPPKTVHRFLCLRQNLLYFSFSMDFCAGELQDHLEQVLPAHVGSQFLGWRCLSPCLSPLNPTSPIVQQDLGGCSSTDLLCSIWGVGAFRTPARCPAPTPPVASVTAAIHGGQMGSGSSCSAQGNAPFPGGSVRDLCPAGKAPAGH